MVYLKFKYTLIYNIIHESFLFFKKTKIYLSNMLVLFLIFQKWKKIKREQKIQMNTKGALSIQSKLVVFVCVCVVL